MPTSESPASRGSINGRALRPLLCALLAGAALLSGPVAARAATEVSYQALVQQIQHGAVIRAVINRAGGDVEIKFRNLSEWKASFPPGGQPALQRLLHERRIHVIFASKRSGPKAHATVHHHLRYIAAGILGALALIALAVLLVRRRSRSGRAAGEPAAQRRAG